MKNLLLDSQYEKGIDLSRYNIISDYNQLRISGVKFAVLKVINSKNAIEEGFERHFKGLTGAAIPIYGGYTYCYSKTEKQATLAAESFVKIAKTYGIDFMWLDLEDVSISNLGLGIVKVINAYRNVAESNGLRFGIYTGVSWYYSYLKTYQKYFDGVPFWWARYPKISSTTLDSTIPAAVLPDELTYAWQWTSNCKINGVAKGASVDANIYYDFSENCLPDLSTNLMAGNPWAEPTRNISLGCEGDDVSWVYWYLWRFGMYVTNTVPDNLVVYRKKIDGEAVIRIKEVQKRLGLEADGIVGKITRSVWKKIC